MKIVISFLIKKIIWETQLATTCAGSPHMAHLARLSIACEDVAGDAPIKKGLS
jgi:hypothetical protein